MTKDIGVDNILRVNVSWLLTVGSMGTQNCSCEPPRGFVFISPAESILVGCRVPPPPLFDLSSSYLPLERRWKDFRGPSDAQHTATMDARLLRRARGISMRHVAARLAQIVESGASPLSFQQSRNVVAGANQFSSRTISAYLDWISRYITTAPEFPRSYQRDEFSISILAAPDQTFFAPQTILGILATLPDEAHSPLTQALAGKVLSRLGLPLPSDPEELEKQMVICSRSSLGTLLTAVHCLTSSGDAVLVPDASFSALYNLTEADRTTIRIPTHMPDGKLTAKGLAEFIKDVPDVRAKVVVITNPSMPLGQHYSAPELIALFKVCYEKKITLVVDELYAHLDINPPEVSPERHVHAASLTTTVGGDSLRLHDFIFTNFGTSKYLGQSEFPLGIGLTGIPDLVPNMRRRLNRVDGGPRVIDSEHTLQYLDNWLEVVSHNPQILLKTFLALRALVRKANKAIGEDFFKLLPARNGWFGCIGVDRARLRPLGVTTDDQFSNYLRQFAGVESTSLESMHMPASDQHWVRINFARPDEHTMRGAFEALTNLGKLIVSNKAPRLRIELECGERRTLLMRLLGGFQTGT